MDTYMILFSFPELHIICSFLTIFIAVCATIISNNKRKQMLIVSLIFVVVALFTSFQDLQFFDFSYKDSGTFYSVSGNPNAVIYYITIKFLYLLLLYFIIYSTLHFMHDIFRGNTRKRRFFVIFLVLFTINLIFILLTWPGIWWCNNADEFKLFSFTKHLQVQYHQGFLMSLFFTLCMMVYPHPATVVIIQSLISSLAFGYIIWDLTNKGRKISSIIIFFIALSPCVLYFNLYPYRVGLTGVFFTLFLYNWYDYCLSDDIIDSWKSRRIIVITAFAAITLNFRMEFKILLLMFPIMIFVRYWNMKKYAFRLSFLVIIVMISSVFVTNAWNNLGNQNCSKMHNLLSFFAPLADIVVQHPEDISDHDMQILDKYLNVEQMVDEHKDKSNYIKFEYERIKKPNMEFPKEDYPECLKIIFRLLWKHSDVFLANKIKLAYGTAKYAIRYKLPDEIKPMEIRDYFKPINGEIANSVKKFIAGDFNIGKFIAREIFFIMWLPAVLLLFQIPLLIVHKSYYLLFSHLTVLILYGIVFLTSMYTYPMYYYAPYIGGLVLFFVSFNNRMERKIKNRMNSKK